MCVIWPRISQMPVSRLLPNLRVLAVRTASNFVSATITFYANFTLNLKVLLACLTSIFLLSEWSVDKRFHILKTYCSGWLTTSSRGSYVHGDLLRAWTVRNFHTTIYHAAVKERMIDQFSNMEMKLPEWLLWRWKLSIRPFVTIQRRLTNTGLELGLALLQFPYNEKRKLPNHDNCVRL